MITAPWCTPCHDGFAFLFIIKNNIFLLFIALPELELLTKSEKY